VRTVSNKRVAPRWKREDYVRTMSSWERGCIEMRKTQIEKLRSDSEKETSNLLSRLKVSISDYEKEMLTYNIYSLVMKWYHEGMIDGLERAKSVLLPPSDKGGDIT